jgi:hypothetical protein
MDAHPVTSDAYGGLHLCKRMRSNLQPAGTLRAPVLVLIEVEIN